MARALVVWLSIHTPTDRNGFLSAIDGRLGAVFVLTLCSSCYRKWCCSKPTRANCFLFWP